MRDDAFVQTSIVVIYCCTERCYNTMKICKGCFELRRKMYNQTLMA